MRLKKSSYIKVDALSKLTGLIVLAAGVESASGGSYFLALALFGLGGTIAILPLFIKSQD